MTGEPLSKAEPVDRFQDGDGEKEEQAEPGSERRELADHEDPLEPPRGSGPIDAHPCCELGSFAQLDPTQAKADREDGDDREHARGLADMGGRYEIRMKRGTLFMACDL